MRTVAAVAAFASSLVAFAVLISAGLFLALVEQSGARGAGVLLVLGAVLGFGSSLLLVFAPRGYFAAGPGRLLAAAAALAAFVPVAALAYGALTFSGLPLGGRSVAVMWAIFAVGAALALGALCIAALGYLRLRETRPEPPIAADATEDIRVTPV